jgi:hypothetical protein
VSKYVTLDIVSATDISLRKRTVEHWIDVAEQMRLCNNFEGLMV